MSQLTVVTWNAEGMFVEGTRTRRASPDDAMKVLRKLDADIVVVPEFGRYQQLSPRYDDAIRELGYERIEVAYEQKGLVPEISMVVLSRLPVRSSMIHRLANLRNCLEVRCELADASELRVLALHLDDRAEDMRLRQLVDVDRIVHEDVSVPTLVLGDFNAMPKRSNFARLARTGLAKFLADSLPHDRLRGIALRVTQMAIGTLIEQFSQRIPLKDLDPGMQRTISAKQYGVEWAPSMRLAKIDWMFGSHQFTVKSYDILNDVGSDHRPVLATLEY